METPGLSQDYLQSLIDRDMSPLEIALTTNHSYEDIKRWLLYYNLITDGDLRSIKDDGSVSMRAPLDMGGQSIVNVGSVLGSEDMETTIITKSVMDRNIDMGGYQIINLDEPTQDNHTATKHYVDTIVYDILGLTIGLSYQGEWFPITTYLVGDIVLHEGVFYVSLVENTNQEPPSETYWTELTMIGGVGMVFRGEYDPDVQYQNRDAVTYDGSLYYGILLSLGNLPTDDTYWALVAKKGTDGTIWHSVSGAPGAGVGVDGDFAIDEVNGYIYGPKAAGAWPAGVLFKGTDGDDGTDGNTILTTSGAPGVGVGVNGDYAIDTAAGLIYGPKAAGVWPAGVSFFGEDGADGSDGTNGTDGADGNTILTTSGVPDNGVGANGDYAIDPTAQKIYGPKAAGVWPAGVYYAGDDGAAGSDGADGATWHSVSGAPGVGVGVDGDFAIDTVAQNIYGPKAAGTWPAGISYAGDPGADGADGSDGADGNTILSTVGDPGAEVGVDGDYAIDVTNYYIYGPKAAGAWPDGVYFKGADGEGSDVDGWVDADETWTYASADSGVYTYTATISGDYSGVYSIGMKVKLTQNTVKYFFITKVVYSAPNTTLTLYGGSSYALVSATISDKAYSVAKAPYGFPLDAATWRYSFGGNTLRQKTTPTQYTYYNIGLVTYYLPIGKWRLVAQSVQFGASDASAVVDITVKLNTATNGSGTTYYEAYAPICGFYSTYAAGMELETIKKAYSLTSKTTVYLIMKTDQPGVDEIDIVGYYFYLECDYL